MFIWEKLSNDDSKWSWAFGCGVAFSSHWINSNQNVVNYSFNFNVLSSKLQPTLSFATRLRRLQPKKHFMKPVGIMRFKVNKPRLFYFYTFQSELIKLSLSKLIWKNLSKHDSLGFHASVYILAVCVDFLDVTLVLGENGKWSRDKLLFCWQGNGHEKFHEDSEHLRPWRTWAKWEQSGAFMVRRAGE